MHDRSSGRWRKGESGNPAGKPLGTRHKATRAAEALLEGETEALTRKCIELAKTGDHVALRLCMERIYPARKDAPVSFDMPRIRTAIEAAGAVRSVLEAVSRGNMTPSEATGVAGIIEVFRRTIETTEIEARIVKLEKGMEK
ncbi:MAG: hypothetical protein FJ311_14140 [Rhodospirillales bacterium]|nr:hypothetical protein [Rhodospirillales bacterium]